MLDLFLITLLLLIGFYWSNSMKAREIAFIAVTSHCRKLGVQLLDEYVALNGLWFKVNREGGISAWRSYLFEFTSTGNDRYNGKIIMLGDKILNIEMDPYKILDDEY